MNYPIVTIQIQDPSAPWYGKWTLNLDSESIKKMGGPWDSQQAAVDRMLKCKGWELRQKSGEEPHFYRI